MDQFLARLNNFAYEILGIFVPGAILLLFLTITWWNFGSMSELWSLGVVPEARFEAASGLLGLLNADLRMGMLIALLVAAYFLGHLLHWSARKGRSVDAIGGGRRVLESLSFRIPKPKSSYDSKLEGVLNGVKSFLGLEPDAQWRQFYPIAKAYLAANLQTSLASTYQNKYTLHRSITAAAAIWFWLSIIGLAGGALTSWFLAGSPRWVPLAFSAITSLVLVSGFSDSYRYNWKLWGDTLISECHMIFVCERPKP